MKLKFTYGLLIVILLIALPLFGHLDQIPVQNWDEARLATSALEMSQGGSWIVTTYNGIPDMWSTKPPFLIWLMALSLKLLGTNEVALRLPSALAAAFTCLFLFWFIARKIKLPWLGICVILVLISTPGYVGGHVARTGDYDAMLILFTTIYTLLFFWYLETGDRKWLLLFFAALTLAVLTKGIAGLLFAPALLFYSFSRRQTMKMFKTPAFYTGMLAFFIFTIGYYLLREHYNPGYLVAVQQNELGGRYLSTLEQQSGDEWYYWNLLLEEQFTYWYLLVPCGIAIGFAAKDTLLQRFTAFTILSISTYFLIITNAATKLGWYDAPMFPFLAILCGLALWAVFNFLDRAESWKDYQRINVLPFLVIALIVFIPYRAILNNVFHPQISSWIAHAEDESIGYFMKDNLNGSRNDAPIRFVGDYEEQHVAWYRRLLAAQGKDIRFINKEELKPGQRIVVHNKKYHSFVNEHFYAHVVDEVKTITIYQLDSTRTSPNTRK